MSSVFVHPIAIVESSTFRQSVTVVFSHCVAQIDIWLAFLILF